MLKENLKQLLREFPSRMPAANYEAALDDAADDIEAACIKELNRVGDRMGDYSSVETNEITDVFVDVLGATLFNAYTLLRAGAGNEKFYFSDRKTIVRAMIRAMLETEKAIVDERNENMHLMQVLCAAAKI